MSRKQPIIAIVGPTASGKSALAIALAKRFSGEIISADSRQVYIDMNIGTGKVTRAEQKQVPHHLLDMVSPRTDYTITHFLHDAKKAMNDISLRNHIPIICGGTNFWIDTLLFNRLLPLIPPSYTLRKQLAKKTVSELLAMLKKLDPKRARSIDKKNTRRLIRAIEISKKGGSILPLSTTSPYHIMWIGKTYQSEILKKRITQRLNKRIHQGLVREVKLLHEVKHVSWKRLQAFGLEYRITSDFLLGKITKKQMQEMLVQKIWQYAKMQMTWLRRNPKIHWVTTTQQAVKHIKKEIDT